VLDVMGKGQKCRCNLLRIVMYVLVMFLAGFYLGFYVTSRYLVLVDISTRCDGHLGGRDCRPYMQ
jgi:hypothetical protein